MEKCPGLLRVLTGHGDGDVLILYEVVAGRRLLCKHPVVFQAVQVQVIPALAHEDAVLEVGAVEAAVVNGDLGHGIGWQAVEDAAVGCEHIPLVLVGGQGVVDVGKAPGLAESAVDLPDPILPNPLDGDGLLYAAGDLKRNTLAPVGRGKSFTHGGAPPF